MKLYVGNLPANTSVQDLEDLFIPYGDVMSARVLTARHGGQLRGFGYVEMSKQHAEVASRLLQTLASQESQPEKDDLS